MGVNRQSLDVRVSKRILWFGAEAYPLPNITRTQTVTLEPNRKAAIRGFAIMAVGTLVVMSIVAGTTEGFVATLAVLAGLAWIGYRLYKLLEFLKMKLYALNIETAAASHRGVISDNPTVITELQALITDAIDNPQAEWQKTVNNIQIGNENFNFSGPNSVGKAYK